jgi:hypothetical protein
MSLIEMENETRSLTTLGASQNQAIAMAAAVLDKRLITARQFPRSIARFKQEAIALLQQDIETARSAEYSKPVGSGKVTGPSVRLAEIACMCWTNIEVEIMEPIVGETSVTVQAFAWDLERNVRVPGISSTSILTTAGTRYKQHMIDNAIMATASKARRNAIQAAIPRAYINDLLEAARKVARDNQKPLEQVRTDMLEFFARSYRVQAEQVFQYLGVGGIEDINLDHVDELRSVVTAIKDGESIEAYFGAVKTKTDLAKEKIAARRAKEQSDEQATSPQDE